MGPARLLPALALVVATSGCLSTPEAADLVNDQLDTGPVAGVAEVEGALREYIGAVNAALDTGDLSRLQVMTDADCPCRDLVGFINSRFSEGGALLGASFEATDVTVLERRGQVAEVRATVSVSAYDVRTADGLVVRGRPAQEYRAVYTMRLEGGDWRAADVRPAPADPG